MPLNKETKQLQLPGAVVWFLDCIKLSLGLFLLDPIKCCFHSSSLGFIFIWQRGQSASVASIAARSKRELGIPQKRKGGCPRGVVVKVMDNGIVIGEFIFQLSYYIHFLANTLGKGMKPPYPPSYGLNSTTIVVLGEWL